MGYGGPDTKRLLSLGGIPKSFAGWVGLIFESLGVLNKGSMKAQAAPDAGDVANLQPISSNTLNVTRVGGIGALISAAGGAALVLFNVNKKTDRASIVVAAYVSVGLIVAAALVTVAVIIAADIRARTAIATATAPPARPVGVKRVSDGGTTALDQVYEVVLVDASTASVELALPSAESFSWQQMTIKREDSDGNRSVTLRPQGQQTIAGEDHQDLGPRDSLHIYSDGRAWLTV